MNQLKSFANHSPFTMSYTNKNHLYLYPFLFLINISCSTSKMSVMALEYTPGISKSVFKNLANARFVLEKSLFVKSASPKSV